jgi:chromosome segregation ATPase
VIDEAGLPITLAIFRKIRADYNGLKEGYHALLLEVERTAKNGVHQQDLQKVITMEIEIEELVGNVKAASDIITELKLSNESLLASLNAKEFDISKLKTELIIQKRTFTAKLDQLKTENQRLRDQVIELKMQLADAEAKASDNEVLKTELKEKTRNINSLLQERENAIEITWRDSKHGLLFVRALYPLPLMILTPTLLMVETPLLTSPPRKP